jgi:hypothetical protein
VTGAVHAQRKTLEALEARLDTADPARAGFRVIDSGEVSAVLTHELFPGRVMKRVAGFPSAAHADTYRDLVVRYCAHLERAGVPCVDTDVVVVKGYARRWTAYAVQPHLPDDALGKVWLSRATAADMGPMVDALAGFCACALAARPSSSTWCTIDAQPSNWRFEDGRPVALLDVTTPLFGSGVRLDLDVDVILRALPAVLRPWARRTRQVERTFATHFTVRDNLRDAIANIAKDGDPALLAPAVAAANSWFNRHEPGDAPLTVDEIERYYEKNARTLELSARLQRLDARAHRMFGVRRDAIVPMPVARRRTARATNRLGS